MAIERQVTLTPAEPDSADGEEQSTQTLVRNALQEAINWRKDNLEPKQTEATEYYKGAPLGNEEEGRSQVVMTTVRDTVRGIMPSLLRVFHGTDHAVEFKPRGPDDEELAKQQTDYIRMVRDEDNPGFLIFHNWFLDALVRKLGVVKWWWDDNEKVTGEDYEGLTLDQVDQLVHDDEVSDVEIEQKGEQPGQPVQDPQTGQPMPGAPEPLYDVKLKRTTSKGRARYDCLPPEEFVHSPNARTLKDARLVAHVRQMPASELVAMGFDRDEVEEARGMAPGSNLSGDSNALDRVRRIDGGSTNTEEESDEAMRPVEYAEIYMYQDGDDDGIAELRLFECMGPSWKIMNGDGEGEIVDERPFALLVPYIEPHTLVGDSVTDLTRDLQRINSALVRGMLDSLAKAIDPDEVVLEDAVVMDDVLSKESSRTIRATRVDAVTALTTPFVGEGAIPVLDFFRTVQEERTGQSRASAGLDADSLQSTNEAAVVATMQGAQQQIEMVARVFAETGVRDLYKGLLRLIVSHQDEARTVRLRGKWVAVDPHEWDADMDLSVNVALGNALVKERFGALAFIKATQEQYLNLKIPFVNLSLLRNTVARMVELSGLPNADEFFLPWGQQEQAQLDQQQAQQQPPPPPEVMTAQIKAQTDLQIQQMRMELKKLELEIKNTQVLLRNDREREKIAKEYAFKEAELEVNKHHEVAGGVIDAHANAEKARLDAQTRQDIELSKAQIQSQTQVQVAQIQAAAAAQAAAQKGVSAGESR